jgi:hypothetical protein
VRLIRRFGVVGRLCGAALGMNPHAPRSDEIACAYSISQPYPRDIVATTVRGLSRACHRWLVSTHMFPTPLARPVIAGVRGRFSEHLTRMISSAELTDFSRSSVWWLLVKRQAARDWSDDATVDFFDTLILPSVLCELFEPSCMLKMQPGEGAMAEWWIEGPSHEDRGTVRTLGPVTYALRSKIGTHLKVPPLNVIPKIVGPNGAPFGPTDHDQPVEGSFSIRVIFGNGSGKSLTSL